MADQQQQRYRVIERLASGGMAEVFKAESAGIEGFKKQVAIKRVLPHLSSKKDFIAMFLDEARLSAQLSHSNVAQVFDIGVGDNTYFIVMEYVDGADLKAVMKNHHDAGKPVPIEAAIYITIKICEGLAYAHERTNAEGEPLNAVHRDISPPNVLISRHGEVKIVDFGLAKASTQLEKSEAGIIKGKFGYLSPEAARGEEVDERTDIFAIGIILWEMLAMKRMFLGKTDYETVKQVQRAKYPPISKIHPDADEALDRILARALAQDRDKRYSSARQLGRDLTHYLYKVGKPVSGFDVAELVIKAVRGRKKVVGEGLSMIDQFIAEALLEFTSLRDDEDGTGQGKVKSNSGAEAFSLDGFDFEPTSSDDRDTVKSSLGDEIDDIGNLAALEEPDGGPGVDDAGDSIGGIADIADDPAPASASGESKRADSSSSLAPPSSAAPASAEDEGGGGSMKAVLFLVIAAGTAAALWFSGVLQ